MWLLPSRNRPEMCKAALDAFAAHGTTPGVLWIDDRPDGYDFPLPRGWIKKIGGGGLATSIRWFFAEYPDLDWYGWMADDNYPETYDFDLKMIEQAQNKYYVYCNGGNFKTPQAHNMDPCNAPSIAPSALVWGGDLVRAVGWLCPPWARMTCIDGVSNNLSRQTKTARYLHDVVVRHVHWSNGGRKRDDTDNITAKGKVIDDLKAFDKWLNSPEIRMEKKRINTMIGTA